MPADSVYFIGAPQGIEQLRDLTELTLYQFNMTVLTLSRTAD